MNVGIVGEATNSISVAMLTAALEAPEIDVVWFADAEATPKVRAKLYGTPFDEGPWIRLLQRLRGGGGGAGVTCPAICDRAGIPYHRPTKFSLERGLPEAMYENPKADFVLLAGCDQLLKENALRLAKNAVINYHYSPLPAYRGKFAMFWQWYNREPKLGYSFHEVDLGVDTGGTVFQEYVDYDPDAPLADGVTRVIRASAAKLPHMLSLAAAGKTELIDPAPQESYYPSSRYRELITVTAERSLDEVLKVFERAGFLQLPNGFRIRHIVDSERGNPGSMRVTSRGIYVPVSDGWILAAPTARLPFGVYRRLVGTDRLLSRP